LLVPKIALEIVKDVAKFKLPIVEGTEPLNAELLIESVTIFTRLPIVDGI